MPRVARFITAIRQVAERGSALDPEVVVRMLEDRRHNGVLDAG